MYYFFDRVCWLSAGCFCWLLTLLTLILLLCVCVQPRNKRKLHPHTFACVHTQEPSIGSAHRRAHPSFPSATKGGEVAVNNYLSLFRSNVHILRIRQLCCMFKSARRFPDVSSWLTSKNSSVRTLNGSNDELGEVDQLTDNFPIVPIEQWRGKININVNMGHSLQ